MISLLDHFAHWEKVREGLFHTLDLFSDEDLNDVPHAGSWPVGGILLHIASAEAGWIHLVLAGALEAWPEYSIDGHTTCQAIRNRLDGVHTKTREILRGNPLKDQDNKVSFPWDKTQSFEVNWIIWHVLEHEIHHRGKRSFILGLLGRNGLDV